MADLAELEQRIAAALARISLGVERLAARDDAASEEPAQALIDAPSIDAPSAAQAEVIAHLQAALDAERQARADADAALNDLQSPIPGADAAEVDRLIRQLDAQGLDNQRLRSSVAQLREELRRMREAAEPGMTDAALINRALQAELDALRAVRASEITEMADILATLGPIVDAEEARHHA